MVDRERVAQYLDALDQVLRDWKALSTRATQKALREDRALGQRACYVMLAAIQTAIDLANLIIADRALPRPDSYRAAFDILEKEKILRHKATAAKLRELAGFRNLLVHRYVDLDPAKTRRNLRGGLSALLAFRKTVSRLLKR